MSDSSQNERFERIHSSIDPPSFSGHGFVETDMGELNLNLLQNRPEFNTKPTSPCFMVNSGLCSSIHEEIREVSKAFFEILPKKISSPYSFLDVKIFKDETHAAGVTSDGVFVILNLNNKQISELSLSTQALTSVLISEESMIAVAKSKSSPILFKIDVISMKLLDKFVYPVKGIGKICLDSSSSSLFARIWDGQIWRISLNNLSDYSSIYSESDMISMVSSKDDVIFIGTASKKILKINSKGELIDCKTFSYRIDAYLFLSHNGEFLMLALPDSIKLLNSNSLEQVHDIHTGIQSYSLHLSIDENYVIAGLESGEIGFYSLFSKPTLKFKIHSSSITSIFTTKDMSLIYTFATDNRLAVTHYPRFTVFKTTLEINLPFNAIVMTTNEFKDSKSEEECFKPLCMAISEKKDLIVVGGESKNIAVWDRQTMKKCGELMGHSDFVYSLACINNLVAVSGGADCKIVLWHYRTMRKISILQTHSDAVSAVVKIDAQRFASGSWDRSVIIWLWEVQEQVFRISDLPDKVVALCTPKFNKLLIGLSDFIYCWDLLTYSEMFWKKSETTISCFRVLEVGYDNPVVYIGLGLDEASLWFEDPFMSKNIDVWGEDSTGNYEFYSYIRQVCGKEKVKHQPKMDRFTVFPYKLNALHFYAYYNLASHLQSAILSGGALLNSSCGSNPLSISIELGHTDCIEAIISAVWSLRSSNPYLLSIISVSTLNELHLMNFPSISKLYKLLMIPFVSCTYINTKKLKLPITLTSTTQTSFKTPKSSKPKDKFCNYRSLISLYLTPGSDKSIKFLYSLTICQDLRVFNTQFIKTLLLVKRQKIKWILLAEVLLFLIHFCCLVWFCLDSNRRFIKIFAFLIGILLFGLELLTTVSIRSGLGILCSVQGVLMIFWIFFRDEVQLLDLVVSSLSAFYGIHYFQIFDKSSKALKAFSNFLSFSHVFIMVLVYFLLFCYGIFGIVVEDYDGGENSPGYVRRVAGVFVAGSVFMYFAFCLGNDYGLTCSQSVYLLKIILKLEILMFWNRKIQQKLYMQVFDRMSSQPKNRIKKIKDSIRAVQYQTSEILSLSSQHKQEIISSLIQLSKSVSLLKRTSSKNKSKSKS